MQDEPRYDNVYDDVQRFWQQRIDLCQAEGIALDRIVLDPGFGFGKTFNHNIELFRKLHLLVSKSAEENLPLLVGVSNKRMISELLGGKEISQRLYGNIAAAVLAYQAGARIIRCHDVMQTVDALKTAKGILND